MMNHLKNTIKSLFIAFVLCVSFSATAQDFTYGIKGGLNIPNLKLEDGTSSKSILGIHAGVFGNFAITEKFAIQPELLYSTAGGKYYYNDSDIIENRDMEMSVASSGDVEDKIKTSHISIPVMLQYKVGSGFYLEAGPQYNFLLSIKEEYDGQGYDDIKEYYKSGTFALGFGAGYDLTALATGLKVGVRYTIDLSDMNKTEIGGGSLKSSMFQVSLGYAFGG